MATLAWWWTVERVSKSGRGTRIKSDIVSVESIAAINMRGGWYRWGRGGKRRRFISRTTRKRWKRAVPPRSVVSVGRSVGRSVRVRAPMSVPRVDDPGPKSAEGLVMRDGGPLGPQRAPRSGSTLKRGIYRGNSFRLRSSLPLRVREQHDPLPLSLRGG